MSTVLPLTKQLLQFRLAAGIICAVKFNDIFLNTWKPPFFLSQDLGEKDPGE